MSEELPYPHSRIEQVPPVGLSEKKAEDLIFAKKLRDDIDRFLNPEAGAQPGTLELKEKLRDYAPRAGVDIDEEKDPLEQILHIRQIADLEVQQLEGN